MNFSKVSPRGFRAVFGVEMEHDGPRFEPSTEEQRRLLLDFVAAARDGDLQRLQVMLKDSVTSWTDGGGLRRAARKPVVGREKVANFFAHIYSRPGLTVTSLDLVTGPALDIHVRNNRHVLTADFDGDRITTIRVVSNPDKLSAIGEGHHRRTAMMLEDD